jgi:hypothetical protein
MKTTIYWNTQDSGIIHRIRQRYNISQGMTVNGETDVEVNEQQLEELREVEKRGFIKLRFKP